MNTQVMFYIMPDEVLDEKALHLQACWQAANYYRNNQRVFIYTEDQALAHQIDELLWAFDPDSFVPHNLVGEGPQNGAAVEISWQAPTSRRAVLINLSSAVPNFAGNFAQIIDFVPANADQKQLARDRFRACRQLGFQVDTCNAAIGTETEKTTTSEPVQQG